MRAEALKRQAYSIAAIRTLARARLPKPVFDFRHRRRREMTEGPQ